MNLETAVSVFLAAEAAVVVILVLIGFGKEATLRRQSRGKAPYRAFPSNRTSEKEIREEIAALRNEFRREIDRVHSDLIRVALGRSSPRF